MANVLLLKDVEEFLKNDLRIEKLSSRIAARKNALLEKVSHAIKAAIEQEKLDEFIAQQREVSRLHSTESDHSKSLPLHTKPPYIDTNDEDEDDGDLYMDLTDIPGNENASRLSPPSNGGSGSGYESYASDEEGVSRSKANKEENLDAYFSTTSCDIYSYVFLENKNKFLGGKKWVRRVGIVEENHFKSFKKPGDIQPVLDVPLRAYIVTLSKKEGTKSVIVSLESPESDGEAHRFYVEREKVDDWTKILREKAMSLKQTTNLPPPPIASRPPSTLPARNLQHRNSLQILQQPSSVAVTERSPSVGDISIIVTDTSFFSPPPVPPGHPTLPATHNYIGKGLKNAMTDMFKKDKTKKRITTAENLGADVCGNLSVLSDGKWGKKWCLVKWNQLLIYGKGEEPEMNIQLAGCDLRPYFDDPDRSFAFKILRDGKELVFMEASSSNEMGKWVGILIAETGCAEMPDHKVDSPYMEADVMNNLLTTAQQAFDSRQKSIRSKDAAKNEEDDENSLYLDLTTEMQVTPQKSPKRPPQKPSLPTQPPSGSGIRLSKSNSSSSTEPDKRKKGGSRKESADIIDGPKTPKKHKDKKDKKRNSSPGTPSVSSPTEQKFRFYKDLKIENIKSDNSTTDSKTEKRKREIATQKHDIKNKMITVGVNKAELQKYIDAATTEKEKGRLRVALQHAADEYSQLEKDDVKLELELRKLKDRLSQYDLDSPANMRPPSRAKTHVHTGTSGNVLARTQMWEAKNKK